MKERLKITDKGPFNKEALLDNNGAPGTEKAQLPKGTKVMSMKKIVGEYTKCKHGNKILWVKTADLIISEKK